jgi:hypothetical protein
VGSKLELEDVSYKLKVPEKLNWAVIHTRLVDPDIKAIIEYTMIIRKVRRLATEPKDEEKKDRKQDFNIKLQSAIIKEYFEEVASLQIGIAEVTLFGSK